MIEVKELLDAGVHFGHLTRKWNPNMAPYIFMERNGIHIIDLNKTAAKLNVAAEALKKIARSGRKIMYVATKKQAKEIVANAANDEAIAIEKEIKPPRPLTHDLFKNFCVRFDIKIKQVIIHKLVDGVFYSSVICERDGIEEIIDSRSSDAIALAIRFEAPIYTYENILEKAGVVLKIEKEIDEKSLLKELFSDEKAETTTIDDLKEKSKKELEELLKIAVQNENYESAAKIRDEISNR